MKISSDLLKRLIREALSEENQEWGPKQQLKLLKKVIHQLMNIQENLQDIFEDEQDWQPLEKQLERVLASL